MTLCSSYRPIMSKPSMWTYVKNIAKVRPSRWQWCHRRLAWGALVEGEVNRSHLNCFRRKTAIGSWRIYQHLQRGAKWFRCRVSIHKHLYNLWPLEMVPFYLHWWPNENCTPISLNFSRWWWFYFHFYFHPYLEKWSNLTNIFRVGWFNHQAVFNGSAILIK